MQPTRATRRLRLRARFPIGTIYITMCVGGAAGLLMGGVLGRWAAGSIPELARRITDGTAPGPATSPQDVGMVLGCIAGLLIGLAVTAFCFVAYIALLWLNPRRGAMQAAMAGATTARSGHAGRIAESAEESREDGAGT